ncbi:OLC1v1038484C3 [Oldenlandia corymbosa var. corymbosa]|uniref:OLC1v1038484C3 n=1 Tax=Oldenlandia corymbosa var. corymbosa TaxID=529605 RepID=A0AAV1D0I6_OLDCO|nr:OLC1v1038484C3 [Oldenlandia corymbosa var. corymbosa]
MPPRSAKKLPPGPGSKRGGRVGRGSARALAQAQAQVQPEAEEHVTAEETQVVEVAKPEINLQDEVAEDKTSPPPELVEEPRKAAQVQSLENTMVSVKKDDDSKESVDELEKSEKLDLEDNDPEYEPEEYGSVDYDEKEIEQEDAQEEGDEIDEDLGEEEGDMMGEEIEDVQEELEGEDNDVHEVEERDEMVDHEEDEDHHELVKERRKRKEFEVFVGGLDKDATEDDLKKVFCQVGEVVEVRLMMNPQTKKNKGFAFLRFATVEQAKRACTELKNPVVHGKQCGVTPSQDSDTLFLGNICKSWTREALRDRLKHYGIDNVEDLTLVEDSNSNGMNRGFAFLEFSSRSDAMDAFKRLQKRDVVFGLDRPAKVSFADSFIDPGDEIMAQVKTVFVDGLLASWDEDYVRKLLKSYGEVEKVELARNMPSAKRKDFGFVTFNTHEAAVTCAKSINNEELGEGDSKAKVRARLSRPLQRGKGKSGSRGELRTGRGPVRGLRSPWTRTVTHSVPLRGSRGVSSRVPPIVDRGFKRPASFRDRRPIMAVPTRSRPLPPPPRPYERRPPVASYPKSSLKRDYGRHEDLLPRSRSSADYTSRVPSERRTSLREDYPSRGSGYSDLPRVSSRPVARREYVDDGYGHRYERPPPVYREVRGREYDSISGSKRPYSAMDDVPPRYADPGVRQSRARLDYELSGSASHYGDAYGDRLGRSNPVYGGGGRNSMSSQDSSSLYSSRHSMGYGGGLIPSLLMYLL